MPQLSHDGCSELLRDYARGSLDATERAAVEEHLAGCVDCAAELTGLRALLATDDEPLTELERARLERGIAGQLGDVIAVPRGRSKLWTRATAGLGAAALLAIVAVGIAQLGTGSDENASKGRDTSVQLEPGAAEGAGGAAAGGANSNDQAFAPAPRPSFDRHTVALSSKKLDRFGVTPQITSFKGYSTKDALRLKDTYVSELAALAPADQQDQVRACAQRVYDSTSGYSLLAAYGADARLDGRRALVLGFAWTDKPEGPLDQYMLWVWPVANCTDAPLNYTSGRIGKK